MGRGGIRLPAVLGGRLLAACVSLLALAACGAGCVGYVMGWSDTEVDRLRRIVAELEAKNATLVEEVIELRTGERTTDEHLSGQAVPGR